MMNHIDFAKLALTVAAFALGASKLSKATLPFWAFMPRVVQRLLPGVALLLGELPAALKGVATANDFAIALLGAAAFAFPGTHAALPPSGGSSAPQRSSKPPPPVIPFVATLCLALVLPACGIFGPAKHPIPKECGVAAQGLEAAVVAILQAPGNWETTLTDLAQQYGWNAVLCAVKEAESLLSKSASVAANDHPNGEYAARAHEFLAEHGQ